MTHPRFSIVSIDLFEREMTFLHPFRFGDVTVRSAPQAFVRAVIDIDGIGRATGMTAEMMMPRWFDRRADRTPADTVDDLRRSLAAAKATYLDSPDADTAFGHRVRIEAAQSPSDLTPLARSYGPSVIDKALLDALLKGAGVGVEAGLRDNLPGLDARLTPDLDDAAVTAFLRGIAPAPQVFVRWTVGMVDDLGDLLVEIERSRLRYLKIKLSGDVAADLDRLTEIEARLAASPGADIDGVTLDANEQYRPDALGDFIAGFLARPDLGFLRQRLLYLEQPYSRDTTLATELPGTDRGIAAIIDESDGDFDAFPRAVALGYRGVSSKSCKGLYKALLNGARAARENVGRAEDRRLFVAGEDLTCQPGLAIQQDTALAALLGISHVERNGHHYVDGFGPAPAKEAETMAAAHPELYRNDKGWRLDVRGGVLPTRRLLATIGFAGGAAPDFDAMQPMADGMEGRSA